MNSATIYCISKNILYTNLIDDAKKNKINIIEISDLYNKKYKISSDDYNNMILWIEKYKNNENINIVINNNENSINNNIRPYLRLTRGSKINAINTMKVIPPKTSRSWFTCKEIYQIYNYPNNNLNNNIVIGVISFGGGLFGTFRNGIITNGDVQNYWSMLNMSSYPTVAINLIGGARNQPANSSATYENTLDVATIGACFGSNATIILYIAPNTNNGFYDVFNTAINSSVSINGVMLKPSIISVSWGAPESSFGQTLTNQINALFMDAIVNQGINICVASGDNGSSDGLNGLNVDFPSSSPYTIACGGTSLICPTLIYDSSSTIETVWSSGGGGLSKYFSSPSYQSNLNKQFRSTPDLSLNADPNTGVLYIVNGQQLIFGGTSIVAPAISAFIGLININYYINNILYGLNNNCFHDVTIGSNGQYSALSGYDNCTGIGSINGLNLSNSLLNMIQITNLSVDTSSISLDSSNSTYQIITIIVPSDATNKIINWTSSDTNVATVSVTGLITFIPASSSGTNTCYITGTTTDNSNISTIINVTTNTILMITSIVLPSTILLHQPTTYTVSPIVTTNLNTHLSNVNLNWLSDDTTVLTLSPFGPTGLITTMGKNGSTIIHCTYINDSGNISASSLVTVATLASGISFNVSNISLFVNSTYSVNTVISPSNTSNKLLTWSSSNTRIATVNNIGSTTIVTAVSLGTAIITAVTRDGSNKTAHLTVSVQAPVAHISLSATSVQLNVSNSMFLTATVQPTSANHQVLWSSDDIGVATVSTTGLVRGISNGQTTIHATSIDGTNIIVNCIINVITLATNISLNTSVLTLHKNQTYQLLTNFTPSNTSNQNIVWSSSNNSNASVSSSGLVTAKSNISRTTATITATTQDGSNKTARATVTLLNP